MHWLRFGLAIVCDFVLVAEHAVLGFHEMRSGLAPAASMAYSGECALPRFAFPPCCSAIRSTAAPFSVYSDFREAISIENRYFTSAFSSLS